MPKPKLSDATIKRITHLRQTGHSLLEIKRVTGCGYGTVSKYIKGVVILSEYWESWRIKRGGSRDKARKEWDSARKRAKGLLIRLNNRDKLLILASLYWGEGTKRELNVINGDPELIRIFVSCLRVLGVSSHQLKISLRIFEDMNKARTVSFWAKTLKVPRDSICAVDVLKGKKKGRLKFGMCRIRVTKSKDYFKLIMSMIDFIKSETKAAVVQRIEQGTPKP